MQSAKILDTPIIQVIIIYLYKNKQKLKGNLITNPAVFQQHIYRKKEKCLSLNIPDIAEVYITLNFF